MLHRAVGAAGLQWLVLWAGLFESQLTLTQYYKLIKGSISLVYECFHCLCFVEFEIGPLQNCRTENINRKPH